MRAVSQLFSRNTNWLRRYAAKVNKYQPTLTQDSREDETEHDGIKFGWTNVSALLTNSFLSSYPFAMEGISVVSKISGVSIPRILKGHVDHVTYNITNEHHANAIGKFLEANEMQKVKHLVFKPDAIDGYLYWVKEDSQLFRPVSQQVSKSAIQGIFVRYFTDNYLERCCLGCLGKSYIKDAFTTESLLQYLETYKPDARGMESTATTAEAEVAADRCGSNEHYLLRNHILYGSRGHLAIDVLSLGITIPEVKAYISNHPEKFSLLGVSNPDNTIRQLYLAEPEANIGKMGVEFEPFLELIEREVIESLSAVQSETVEDLD